MSPTTSIENTSHDLLLLGHISQRNNENARELKKKLLITPSYPTSMTNNDSYENQEECQLFMTMPETYEEECNSQMKLQSTSLVPLNNHSKEELAKRYSLSSCWWKKDSPTHVITATLIAIIFIVISSICLFELHSESSESTSSNSCNGDYDKVPEYLLRTITAAQCGEKLSNAKITDSSSPQGKAVDWFVTGAGNSIEIPKSLEECTWNTVFGTYYSLLIIQESLQLTSWDMSNSTHDINITSVKDACSYWSRISCNENSTNVTKLHLSHANLSGDIPHEIAGLRFLDRIELYSNDILGTIPNEIGTLAYLQYLYLHRNSIKGSLPQSFGNLMQLKELFLEHTDLNGTIPSNMCHMVHENGLIIHADCAGNPPAIYCDCCVVCDGAVV